MAAASGSRRVSLLTAARRAVSEFPVPSLGAATSSAQSPRRLLARATTIARLGRHARCLHTSAAPNARAPDFRHALPELPWEPTGNGADRAPADLGGLGVSHDGAARLRRLLHPLVAAGPLGEPTGWPSGPGLRRPAADRLQRVEH